MAGSFDFIHIKRHTKGSSNEISFDVLDAARDELDSKGSKETRAVSPGGLYRGSYHGVAGTSTLSAIPEVEKRKKMRQRHAVRLRVIVAVLVVAAMGGLGYFAYDLYQGKVNFSSRFDGLISQVEESDKDLLVIDDFMKDPLTDEHAQQRKEAPDSIASLKESLTEVEEGARIATRYATNGEDSAALDQLTNSLESRRGMIAAAEETLELLSKRDEQMKKASSAWAEVVNADQKAREATSAANKATSDESTQASRDMTQEAIGLFEQVKNSLKAIQDARKTIDFSAELSYVDKRIESLNYAVSTSDALIAGDRDAATAQNDAYNAADQEAAHMAESLPLMLDDIVSKSFEEELASLLDEYEAQRELVVKYDASVRAYLKR